MAIIARHLSITGRVQGVFYRDWTVETAEALGLAGWVRNRRDGSVEAVAIGDAETVALFIDRCREGSPPSRVDDIAITEVPADRLTRFEKRPTA